MCYDDQRTRVVTDATGGRSMFMLRRTFLICSVASLLGLMVLPTISSAAGSPSATSTAGTQLWAKRFNGYAKDSDAATAIAVSPDGARVFVTGSSLRGTRRFNSDYATVAYSASTGAWLWAKRYNGPGNGLDDPMSLGVSPDGTQVFVTGGSMGTSGNNDYATIAYDASTGTQRWIARYEGPGR